MTENRSTDRPRDEADCIDGEGLQCADPRIGVREEQLGEDEPRYGAVEEEIVPLDRSADRRGNDRPAKLGLMFVGAEGGSERDNVGVDCRHGMPPHAQRRKTKGSSTSVCRRNAQRVRRVPPLHIQLLAGHQVWWEEEDDATARTAQRGSGARFFRTAE